MGFLAFFLLLLIACQPAPESAPTPDVTPKVSQFASDLLHPVGMAEMADGTILVAEEGTGEDDLSAGISFILPDGQVGRLVSELPSGRDSGDLSGVPFVKLSPDGRTILTAHFNLGHLYTVPLPDRFSSDAPPLAPEDLDSRMLPLNNVQLTNPFDLTFAANGAPVVTDASGNGVAIENEDGTTRFFHRFDTIPTEGGRIDAVPTGIERIGDEYFVTLTGGCPYPAGSGRLVAIDENRNERTVSDGLNMPIDVAQGADGKIWLLEFARFDPDGSCFSGTGYLPDSGRLSRVRPDGSLELVLDNLNFPTSVLPRADGSLLISQVFSGNIIQVQWGEKVFEVETAVSPATNLSTANGLRFSNVAAQVGLDFQHGAFQTDIFPDPVAMMGGGLCWIDYDRDGWLDLYLVNSHAEAERPYWEEQGGLPTNQLFRNDAGHFSDVTEQTQTGLALRGNGCVAADFNVDGWPDLYVTADGPNALLWNQGDGTFVEGAAAAGVAAPEWNSAANVADLNLDGWPDLFVAAYINLDNKVPNPSGAFPQDYFGLPDRMYLNNGDGTFRDVAIATGLMREERGLGAIFTDLDEDGRLELYIANDGHPNRLYTAVPDDSEIGFHFADLSLTAEVGDSGSGMGIAGGDYDGDGRFDLFVTNWDTELNALYRNELDERGELVFRYSTYRIGISGLGNNMTGWGTHFADFDQDGDVDLLVVNGRVPISNLASDAELVRFYGNLQQEGQPGQFREWTQQVNLHEEGVGPLLSRGSAAADYDNDGDLDVAINTIGGAPALLQNESSAGNWLQIGFDGFYPGAMVEVMLPDGRVLKREWLVGSSYLASEDTRLHVGLGDFTEVSWVRVHWQGQLWQETAVPANQLIIIR